MKKLILLGLWLSVAAVAPAKVKLPSVLGSHMVLQRETDVNLWGEAAPGRRVKIVTSWNRTEYRVTAGKDGRWLARVSTPEAGGPYSIRISDGEPLVLDDVLIGEVWVCSGQSNMQLPLEGNYGEPTEGFVEALLSAQDYPDVRLFNVGRTTSDTLQRDCEGEWQRGTAENIAPFSAAGYFFGRNLSRVLGIPVGLVGSNWGGTRIEAWMTTASAEKVNPEVMASDEECGDPNRIGGLYNAMIAPISHYTARGFIWYQGESNIATGTTSFYADYMETMVALWRQTWGDDGMPFYYVQLAPEDYDGPDGILLPLLIEQQVAALDRIPACGMAGATDIGAGPDCHHPPMMKVIGERLALLALNRTYGQKGFPDQCPVYRSARFEGNRATVRFETSLSLGPIYAPVSGFEIAGEDRVFHPARAEYVSGRPEIVLTADEVPAPVAVRYAFCNVPENATLCNTAKLPAVPFRTDRWDDVK